MALDRTIDESRGRDINQYLYLFLKEDNVLYLGIAFEEKEEIIFRFIFKFEEEQK
ncbi:MAG: hypothetical protein WC006_05900 [Bacilli bacterium]|nr:hypothetical protein [Bacilli bacterium]